MKKLLTVILCAALALSLAACSLSGGIPGGETAAPEESNQGSQIPNPVVSVEDASAFETLGITMDAPDGAQNIAYAIIDNTLAQISFTFNGFDYTYRASATQSDISGVYDSFTDAFVMRVETTEATFDATVQNAVSGGRLASWSQGGVSFTLWCALAPDDAALKACVLSVMAKTFGEVSSTDDADGANLQTAAAPKDFTGTETLDMDLNGDGFIEHVAFEPTLDDQGYILSTNVRIASDDGGNSFVVTELVCEPAAAIAYDIDNDGLVELFISGDVCSCDYETYMLRYDGGEIISADPCYIPEYEYDSIPPAAFGTVEKIENGVITIADTVDVLGSWWCRTQYQMTATGFGMERVPGSVWVYDSSDYTAETWDWAAITSAEFPVTLDGAAAPTTLPVGTKLVPLDTDGETYVHFITEDGTTGTIYVTASDDYWGWLINGVDEYDLFSNEPYAG